MLLRICCFANNQMKGFFMARTSATSADDAANGFSALAGEWWDAEGAFRILHRMNPLRVAYVRDRACVHFGRDKGSKRPLQDLQLLDAGCGGGLLAEPLARLGASVTGLDASAEAIAAAKQHAKKSRLSIDYRTGRVEDLIHVKTRYDIVTAFEILEHVDDAGAVLKACAHVLKPGGLFVAATVSRTVFSYLFGILAAEHVLGWAPPGAHEWEKFMRPSELVRLLEGFGLEAVDLTGLAFNPLTGKFEAKKSLLDINYLLSAEKK